MDPKFIGKPFKIESTTIKADGPAHHIEFFAYEKMPGPEDQDELNELHAKLQLKTEADKYRDTQGKVYAKPTTHGWTSVDVLQQLWGLPLTDLIMAFVHSLRPSCVRITTGEETCDSWPWRVTITVDDKDIVQKIDQEVEVAWGTGFDVEQCLRAAKTGEAPRALTGCIGHLAGLERVDFQ